MTKKENEAIRQPKKLQGVVTNVVDGKTIKVKVETKYQHPLYKKIIKKHKNYLVHSTNEGIEKGQIVWILEGKPISKTKKFYLLEKAK